MLPSVTEALQRAAAQNAYGPVVGSLPAREAAAGSFACRGLATDPGQVIFAPGSKALLYGVFASVPGDPVLPPPSWVTYAAQVAFMGKRIASAPAGPTGCRLPSGSSRPWSGPGGRVSTRASSC